mgnify:CR=1 FL=1
MSEIIQTEDHRRVFINTLLELAEKDPKIVLLIPDVGFNYVNKDTLPGRYFNTGVTEYTSMVMAAAMALSGLKPFFYTMIPFCTFRVHEQVRNAIALHKANVKILGVLGGPSYKMLGLSHNLIHPLEDVNMMKEMPGMQIYIPNTNDDVVNAVLDAYSHDKPSYIKL